ncbi:MAG: hypothetical protein IPF99_35345 [Deltaproteobacteria bacterium]|nr:hypothetical protein [Deltaproteobacteria bacterium]
MSKVLELDERRLPTGMTATRSVTVFCSPENATPEQLSASRTGPWTDVYQFALVVTEMLTHQRAQRGDDLVEAQRDAMSPTRPTPAAHGVDVGTWEPVLARAVALRPADRYADAGQLLEALEANLPGVPSGAMNTPGTPASPPAPSGLTASPPGADEVDDLTATVAQPNPHLRVVAPLSPATATLPSAEVPRTVPVVDRWCSRFGRAGRGRCDAVAFLTGY